jgi:hypothetical protein
MSPSIRRGALATTCLALTACAGATSGAAARPGDRTATGPAAAAAQVSSSQVTAAHLRITVTTTSDWTQLRLHGVTIEAQRLSHAGGGHWSRQPFGPALTNGGGHATVTDDLVVSDPSGRRSFTWTIQKGYAGSTQVRVVNRNGPRPTRAATYTDAVHSRSHSTNPKRVALSRETVMGRHRLTWPRADTRHLVLADFYPWWSTYDDPRLADRPSDPRSTTTLAGVESLTAQAASHGVDGFVVSWDGESGHGAEFRLARRAARDHHQLVTGYLETVEAKQAGHLAATERKWLSQLLTHASNPAFLHASGVPVVFVYEMSLLPPGRWRHILAAVRRRTGSPAGRVGAGSVRRDRRCRPAAPLRRGDRRRGQGAGRPLPPPRCARVRRDGVAGVQRHPAAREHPQGRQPRPRPPLPRHLAGGARRPAGLDPGHELERVVRGHLDRTGQASGCSGAGPDEAAVGAVLTLSGR